MGDRVRIGELLAAIGTVGLALSLGLLHWFRPEYALNDARNQAALAIYPHHLKTVGADVLGWFAFVVMFLTLIAGIVFILRVLTGRGPERAMLQAPVLYLISGFTFLVLLVRVLIFQPSINPDSVSGLTLLTKAQFAAVHVDVSLTIGAYVGLLAVFLVSIGAWFSMYDERTGSAAAKKRTAELLAAAPVRAVPHVPAPAGADADVVADDSIATDPETPFPTAPGEPA